MKPKLVPRSIKLPEMVDGILETKVRTAYKGNRSRAYASLLSRALGLPDPNESLLEDLQSRVQSLEKFMLSAKREFRKNGVEL